MTKAKTARKKVKPKKENAVVRYLRGTRAELRKVQWPTRQEAWNLTKIVLAVTVSMAVFLGLLLDNLLTLWVKGLIDRSASAIGVTVLVIVAGIMIAVILSRQRA